MKSHLIGIAIVLAMGLLLLIGVVMAAIEAFSPRRSAPTIPPKSDRPSFSTEEVIARNNAAIEKINRLLAQ